MSPPSAWRWLLWGSHRVADLRQVEDLDQLNIIHVTGTKGKVRWGGGAGGVTIAAPLCSCPSGTGGFNCSPQGSVCAFTECILRSYGLKTGFYRWVRGGQEGFGGCWWCRG